MIPVPEIELARTIIYRGFQIPCEIVDFGSWYDTVYLQNGNQRVDFFQDKTLTFPANRQKFDWEAKFDGDRQIIRANRYLEVYYLRVFPRRTNAFPRLIHDDVAKVKGQGFLTVKDDKTETIEEPLCNLMHGPDLIQDFAPGDPGFFSGAHFGQASEADVYRLLQPVVLPGGSGVTSEITFESENDAGIDLEHYLPITLLFYGAELIPVGDKRKATGLSGAEK